LLLWDVEIDIAAMVVYLILILKYFVFRFFEVLLKRPTVIDLYRLEAVQFFR